MDYQSSGVNINAGNDAVERIKPLVKSTFNQNVLTGLGQFASFYELPTGYKEPVLVSCTDGVGTKIKVAIAANKFDTVGIDLVAMCVNDLICCGAKPLYFLDYIAVHKLDPSHIESLVKGMVDGCNQSNCALTGGEMAEMNDMVQPGEFDVAGFCVGVVEKSSIINGSKISNGDYVYGLASSGIHSNGYSLVRRICTDEVMTQFGISQSDLLTPTKIYVEKIHQLIHQVELSGIAHITGGGLIENIQRILPGNYDVTIDWTAIKSPEIFRKIQTAGQVSDYEMRRVFNMGIGMVVITPEQIDDSELSLIGRINAR